MSFEEEHPSLKGKECYVDEFHIGEIPEEEVIVGGIIGKGKRRKIKIKKAQEPNTFRGRTYNIIKGPVYPEKDIHKTQIDKQRVKEVIDEWINILSNTNQGIPELNGAMIAAYERIKQELGIK